MRIKYVGSHTEGVELAATGQLVEHEGTVEVSDELALSLCDQEENWQPADAGARKVLDGLRAARAKAEAAVAEEVLAPADAADATTTVVEKGDLS
jgi:ATPase subunit of ABC transporter with duplicated ATPase domains